MTKSTYPHWVFDNSPIPDPFGYGQDAVDFLRALKHPASTKANKAFHLTDWQERIIRRIYGPRNPDKSMIVKTVLLFLPRGNRKTSLAAALALLHTVGPEAVEGGHGIFAAKDKDQAKIAFEEAAGIIAEDEWLSGDTTVYGAKTGKRLIVCPPEKTTLEVISSDGGKAHGGSPTFILADELHVWKSRELWGALKSSRVKKRPLTIICTTAGAGSENLLWDEYSNACRIASGEKESASYLPILFAAEPDDPWDSEETWRKANPGLSDGMISIEEFRDLVADARDRPSERRDFLQFNLNVWQSASRSPLFEMAIYDEGRVPVDLADEEAREEFFADLEGLPCFLGVDVSINGDLTAVVAAWRHDEGGITIHPWFFVPGELREKSNSDRVPYEQWRDEGLIFADGEPVVSLTALENHIRELCARFDVREIAFDPHLARQTMQSLHDDGLPVVEMHQRVTVMGPAIGLLERAVNGRTLRHAGHPTLRHHFDSVVASRNDTGLVRMHVGRKGDRKDGATAAAMAVGRASLNDNSKSLFDLDPEEYDAAYERARKQAA